MFNGRLCLAYANSGQPELYIENYLKKMIKDSEGVSETEASAGSTAEGDDQEEVGSVPVFGCTTLLVKSEHLLPECTLNVQLEPFEYSYSQKLLLTIVDIVEINFS